MAEYWRLGAGAPAIEAALHHRDPRGKHVVGFVLGPIQRPRSASLLLHLAVDVGPAVAHCVVVLLAARGGAAAGHAHGTSHHRHGWRPRAEPRHRGGGGAGGGVLVITRDLGQALHL